MNNRRPAVLIGGLLALAILLPGPGSPPAKAFSQAIAITVVATPLPATGRAVSIPAPAPAPAAPPRVVLAARTAQPVVALTFDLDMTPDMAAQLRSGAVRAWINQDALGVLRSTGSHATLFMTGLWAEVYPGLARSLALDPNFEIADHSYSHPAFHLPCYRLGGLAPRGIPWQIAHAQTVIKQITGVAPNYFRFPGGCYDRNALDAVHAAGLIPVQWSLNAMDAFNPNAAGIAATVLAGVKPGAIVVMHLQGGPNAPATGPALRMIIPVLHQRGYRLVTVGELLRLGPAIEPQDPAEVVEAYQPPLVPSAAVRPCWRWESRLRVWVRC